MPATYEKIATTTISGSSTNTVSFTSIASSWTDLRIVCVYRDTTNAFQNTNMTFNSDTATNYSFTRLMGNGSAASSSRLTNRNSIIVNNYTNGSSSTFWEFDTIDIFSYAGSTNKTCLLTQNYDRNGSGEVAGVVGLWRSTSAITRIDIKIDVTNFSAGSTFTLYGILIA